MSLDPAVLTSVGQFADMYLALKGKGLARDEALDLIERIVRVYFLAKREMAP